MSEDTRRRVGKSPDKRQTHRRFLEACSKNKAGPRPPHSSNSPFLLSNGHLDTFGLHVVPGQLILSRCCLFSVTREQLPAAIDRCPDLRKEVLITVLIEH